MKRDDIYASGKEAIAIIRELIRKGNVNRIVVRDDEDEVILNIPLSLLAVGVLLAPILAGIGVGLALVKRCRIEVEWNTPDDRSDNGDQDQ